MPFPYPDSKENTLVTDRQENSVLLQLGLEVAISEKHRRMEGSLGAFWNVTERCICSYFFLTNIRNRVSHRIPPQSSQNPTAFQYRCWKVSKKTSHLLKHHIFPWTRDTVHLLIASRAGKTGGLWFYYYYFSTRRKPLCWETQTHTSCRQQH